jgi:hypothetical protein
MEFTQTNKFVDQGSLHEYGGQLFDEEMRQIIVNVKLNNPKGEQKNMKQAKGR